MAQRKTTRAQDYVENLVNQNEAARAIWEHSPDGRYPYDANFRYIAFANGLASLPPINLNNAEEIIQRNDQYLIVCTQFATIPSISSYSLALGTTSQGLENILNDSRHNIEAQKAIRKQISVIETIFVNKTVENKINPANAIFILKNQFGYKDQSEIALQSNAIAERSDPKALEMKYKAITEIDE